MDKAQSTQERNPLFMGDMKERAPRGLYAFSIVRALGNWKVSFLGEIYDEYGNIVDVEGYEYGKWLLLAIWHAWRDYRYKVSVE